MRLTVSSVVVVLCLILGQPSWAQAQMVDTSDPCLEVLFPLGTPGSGDFKDLLVNGSRNNREQVELVASLLRAILDEELRSIQKILDELKTKPPSNQTIARMRSWYGCLPWLKRQVALLESDLKRLGIGSIQMPQDRHQVQREQLIRDAIDDLEAIERLLGPVVKGRRHDAVIE